MMDRVLILIRLELKQLPAEAGDAFGRERKKKKRWTECYHADGLDQQLPLSSVFGLGPYHVTLLP